MKFRIVLSPAVAERLKRVGKVVGWVAGTAFAAGIVFVFSFFLAMKSEMRSTQVRVPDLTLLTVDEAEEVAGPLELQLQVVDQRHDPAVASGKILQQEPAPDASVRRGRKVKLVLSLGGRVLEVPDLTGKGDRAVEIELRRDGFAPGDEARVHSPGANQGRIIGQVPPAGSPAVPNTRVHRLVSEGERPATFVMPDLTGLSRTAAERWIRVSGFRVGPVRKIPSVSRASGTVLGQIPLAGYPVCSREIIEITVAR